MTLFSHYLANALGTSGYSGTSFDGFQSCFRGCSNTWAFSPADCRGFSSSECSRPRAVASNHVSFLRQFICGHRWSGKRRDSALPEERRCDEALVHRVAAPQSPRATPGDVLSGVAAEEQIEDQVASELGFTMRSCRAPTPLLRSPTRRHARRNASIGWPGFG